MDSAQVWDRIISRLAVAEMELQLTKGRWFRAYVEKGELTVDNIVKKYPKYDINSKRHIDYKEFEAVCSRYDRWAKGERGIRRKLRDGGCFNVSYVLALIGYARQEGLDATRE